MSTHNICFRGEIRKILTGYPLLSRPVVQAHVSGRSRGNFSQRTRHVALLSGRACPPKD